MHRKFFEKHPFSLGTAFIVFMIFAGALSLSGANVYAGGGPSGPPGPACSNQASCLTFASNHTSGNQSVRVQAGTPQFLNASLFNVWLNGTGPLNFSNGGITLAILYNNATAPNTAIYNSTNVSSIPLINNASFGPSNDTSYINLVLNQSATLNMVQVNLTINGNMQYFPSPNSTMFTINYIAINTNVPNAVFMAFNSSSKQFISDGPGGADARGVYAQHCIGVVAAGACIGEVPQAPNNFFIINGVPMCQQSGGFPPGCNAVFINSTQTIYAFDFASSNTSVLANVTPGTPLTLPLNITSAVSFMWASALRSNNTGMGGPFDDANISSFDVYDYNTSNKLFSVQSAGMGGSKGQSPLFLAKGRFYNISLNIAGYGVSSYPLMFPYSGFTGLNVVVSNSAVNTTTIYGKVVNESNSPVQNAIVYIQMHGGSSGDNLMFLNSAMTDINGVFSLTVPQTGWIQCGMGAPQGCQYPWPEYQFVVMSNQTNPNGNGAPLYFQTTDNNNGKGYVAQSSTVYLPKPIVLKSGGQANVNVTLNGAGTVVSELAKFLSLGTGLAKDAVTGKLTMLSIFNSVTLPTSVVLPLFSPTGNVLIDLLGKPSVTGNGGGPFSGSVTGICVNTSVPVTQGGITPVSCNITTPGYLNITLRTCPTLFGNVSCSRDRNAGDFGFWFGTRGIIRDNATGSTVLYLSPDGIILPMLIGFNSNPAPNILVPLPAGNYTFELAPGFEWSDYLGMANGTAFQILSNLTQQYDVPLVRTWRINPMFSPSMTLSGNNTIEASVEYPGSNSPILDNASVSVSARVLYMNKSAVPGVPVTPLAFNSSKQRFVNTTFTPGALGVTAGKYLLMLSATNITGSVNYTSTFFMPMNAYDFQVGLDLGGFTFGTGQNVSGKIFAFNSTGPIPSNTTPVIVQMIDQSGTPAIGFSASVSGISQGTGSITITMPTKVGFYNIVTIVNSSSGMGISDNWVQISNFNIQAATDKFGYQPNDLVVLGVKLSNASSGAAIQNAAIEVTVDNKNSPAAGATDSTGKAVINLAPAIYGESSTSAWSFGWHNLRIKISIPTAAGDVVNAETWAGFNVRGMEAFIKPNKPSYSQQDTVMLDMFSPPSGQAGLNITAVKVDGSGVAYAINNAGPNYNQINLSSNWAPGHHDVEVKLGMGGSSGTQSFFTGFEVSTYSIFAMTNKFSYNLNETITLNVTVAYPQNGSAVSSTPVNATLYKVQPPNDILATTANGSTDPTGKVGLTLNATQPGFNYIKINAGGQLWFIGVQVSSINVQLQNSTGGAAVPNNEYAGVADGSTPVIIVVNATTSGGLAVPDGSDVRATIWAFGRPQELPSAKTAGGMGNISFTIPSFAPAQVYGLEVRVVLPSGDTGFAPRATLRVSGGSSMQLTASADRSFMQPYMAGDSAAFVAALTYTNGTAASGRLVKFSYGSERTMPKEAGNATTDANGVATLKTNAPLSDGPYYLLARVDGTDIQAYSGFLVSSLKVILTPNASGYAPGDTMLLNITVTNRTSGAQINATGGFISIFNKNKGKRDSMINLAGGQPYQVPVSIPGESGAVGSYPIGAAIFSSDSQGFGFALVNVMNASTQISIMAPPAINASSNFTFNISAGTGTTAKVAVFSPAASSVVYSNDSVVLAGTPPSANITIAPDYAGVYIIRAFVDGVGTSTKVISVMPPASGAPVIWTHTTNSTSSSTSTAVFSTANDVYIMSNMGNATATIMSVNTATNTTVSSSLPLKTPSGSGVYYGTFSKTGLTSGLTYFVRLDTDKASGVAKAMFTVQ